MTRARALGLGVATINDVAARAGVSKRTVSRVMNDLPNITPDTRARVMHAAQRLGYRPNPAARRLASGRSQLVALFHSVHDLPDASFVETLSAVLAESRYRLVVCSFDHHAPNAPAEAASLARHMALDGAFVCAPLAEHVALELEFYGQEFPYVLVGPTLAQHRVATSDRAGAREMTRYLLSLGHERIAFICGPPDRDTQRQRRQGFFDGFNGGDVGLDRARLVQGADTFESGLACGRRLLGGSDPRPSAIFASSDAVAAGVLVAAHEVGIAVPTHLSVAGFGDQPLARQVWPALTTVRLPMLECAARAATLLLGILGDNAVQAEPDEPAPGIIVRGSTSMR